MSEADSSRLTLDDDRARAEAVDPARSFIVQAPAGSGKTGLLVLRLLGLLGRVERPEAILAITFTRKAQAEMRHRVIQALTEAAEGTPLADDAQPFEHERRRRAVAALERSQARGWELLAQPERIGILTIDAFNSKLVHRLPITSGIGVAPQAREDATGLFDDALREVLRQLEDDNGVVADAIERVLGQLDNDPQRLERLLRTQLAGRDRWQRHLDVLADTDSLQAALGEEVSLRLAELRERLPEGFEAGLMPMLHWALAHPPPSPAKAATHAAMLGPISSCTALPGSDPGEVAAWQGIAWLLLAEKGTPRGRLDVNNGFPTAPSKELEADYKARKQQAMAWIEATLGESPELAEAIHAVRKLPPAGYSPLQADALLALGTLLRATLQSLAVASVARGELDFPALASGALAALGPEDAPTDLGLALDARLEHILLDEFQDTSPSQVNLLTRLVAGWQPGDGRTLFLVGDPMQSIYGFRDAEVGLFLKTWHQARIGEVPLERRVLRRNFRSRAGIVDWVNRSFDGLMPSEPDLLRGRIAYSASLPAARDRDEAATVAVHPARDRQEEAAQAVELVRAVRARHPSATIALLGRTRSQLVPALMALNEAGMPVQGVGLETLGSQPVVRDILALARALAHPGDRLAWLSILRAPWCGLDLQALEVLAGGDGPGILQDRIRQQALHARLAAGMRERLERCLPVLEQACVARATTPLAARVERCWVGLGGPLCLTGEVDRRAAWQCLRLMAAHTEETLEAFATELERTQLEVPPGASAGLQAMTMHKAKGLEFDVVLLLGLGGKPRQSDRPLLELELRMRPGGDDSLLLAPIAPYATRGEPIADFLAFIHKEGEREEELRLLYVAATRARRELHLLATAAWRSSKDKGERWEPASGSLLQRLWPVLGGHWKELPPPPGQDGDEDSGGAGIDLRPLVRLPLGWRWPVLPADLEAPGGLAAEPDAEIAEAIAEAPEYAWAGRAARAIGSTVHATLQVIAEDGLSAWDEARVVSARDQWRAQLAVLGLGGEELQTATDKVAQAIARTLGDARGRWCLSPHEEARSEWSLGGVLDGEVVHRIIDRWLVVDGEVWIVDFKTSSHEGGGLEAFLDNEVERYRSQLEGYARLLATFDPRPIQLGLYFPLLGGWRSWRAGASA
jgi:ATP-dependent helicase/nuclease subunit A